MYPEQVLKPGEAVGIARQQRQRIGVGGRRDEQIGRPAAGRSLRDPHRGVHEAVGASRGSVEGKRLEGGFHQLKALLPAGSFMRIAGGMRSRREFGKGDGADRTGFRTQRPASLATRGPGDHHKLYARDNAFP